MNLTKKNFKGDDLATKEDVKNLSLTKQVEGIAFTD